MNGKTILVVEDCEEIRNIVARLLAMSGYEVQQADSVARAVTSLETSRPAAILTDVLLPDGTADDIISHAGKYGEPIPVIAMSGFHRRGMTSLAGTVAYVEKPFKANDLIQAVTAACGGISG